MKILQKSAQIDKAAKKFDTNPDRATLGGGSARRQPTGGFLDEVALHGGSGMVAEESYQPVDRMNVEDERYMEALDKSGMPAEVVEAMRKNPIPQPDAPSTGFSEEAVQQIRGTVVEEEEYYSDDDEGDFYDNPQEFTRRQPARQPIREEVQANVSPDLIKRLVNQELKKMLPKVLPNLVEHYMQQSLIKENMDILKKIKPSKRR